MLSCLSLHLARIVRSYDQRRAEFFVEESLLHAIKADQDSVNSVLQVLPKFGAVDPITGNA